MIATMSRGETSGWYPEIQLKNRILFSCPKYALRRQGVTNGGRSPTQVGFSSMGKDW